MKQITIWPASRGIDYETAVERMKNFTLTRNDETVDVLWPVEVNPVFTLGYDAQTEHILDAASTTILRTDRGGEVSYHGPGQVGILCLINLRRNQLTIKELVTLLEEALIIFIQECGIDSAYRVVDAPGVYVNHNHARHKIASLGLKIKHGCSYHGVVLNLKMDLEPFERINTCGMPGLKITDLSSMGVDIPWDEAAHRVCTIITEMLIRRKTNDSRN